MRRGKVMEPKTPVLLLVLVETPRLRWFVAAAGPDGQTTPLLCSEAGDLEKYTALDFDEQVAFLRHRFCGVLQKGCDRLWARAMKARQFAIVFEGVLPEPTGELTRRVAEHFAEWMLSPPVAVYDRGGGSLERLAGALDVALEGPLRTALAGVLAAMPDAGAWELSRKKVT